MLAVIGGSGVYDIGGLANKRWVKVESPSGAPSDELLLGELEGQPLVFLSRHYGFFARANETYEGMRVIRVPRLLDSA